MVVFSLYCTLKTFVSYFMLIFWYCRHKAHLGWNQDGGFSQETYNYDPMDDSVKAVLRAAGENPERMSKDDLEFSKKFITGYQEVPQVQPSPAPVHHSHPR